MTDALPSQCAVCRAWGAQRVCADCVGRFTAAKSRCLTCALPLPGGAARCGVCLQHGSVLDACYAAVDYDYPWDGILAKLKFDGGQSAGGVTGADPAIARTMAHIMHQHTGLMQALAQAHWVLPVPLSASRLRERGFNQALQITKQLLRPNPFQAAPLARLRTDLLLRTRDTPAQVGLGRTERQRNMLHAFAVEPALAAQVQGAQLVLVDDVTTTTATLCAAAAALRNAGAAQVVAIVFARTPAGTKTSPN
jgi:ComF family protein